MKQTKNSIRLTVLAWMVGCTTIATATPTGLNNIPTADIVPNRTLAIQAFGSFGSGVNQFSSNGPGDPAYWMGFKTGLEFSPVLWEFGMDSPLWVERSGPFLFQNEAGCEPWKNGKVTLLEIRNHQELGFRMVDPSPFGGKNQQCSQDQFCIQF